MGSQDGRLEGIGGGSCVCMCLCVCVLLGRVGRERREKERKEVREVVSFLREPSSSSASMPLPPPTLFSLSLPPINLAHRTVRKLELRLSRADELLGPREQEESDAH